MKIPHAGHVTNEVLDEMLTKKSYSWSTKVSHTQQVSQTEALWSCHTSLKAIAYNAETDAGKKRQARKRKQWLDDLAEWTQLTMSDV